METRSNVLGVLGSARAVAGCVLTLFVAAPAVMAVGNFCPSGTCDITDPIYVNVYWDLSTALWNTNIAANDASATVDRLDALTSAICHSAYFSQLKQYSITSCSVLPSIIDPVCSALSPASDLTQANQIVGTFATCIVNNHPSLDPARTILNVFVPPQINAASPKATFCNSAVADHDKFGSPVAATFIPTNAACNAGISAIVESLTHEMVEATTDPNPSSPTGWKSPFDGEIADQCKNASTAFLYGSVAQYYSNLANGCTDGVSSAINFTPVISSIKSCGSGRKMRFTIQGMLGSSPWDLQKTPGGSKTMFLQAAVSGANSFSAGGIENFPPDSVGFGPISWKKNNTSDSIVIQGFDSSYGGASLVHPGDPVAVTVSSWLTGQSATGMVTAQSPSKVVGLVVQPVPVKQNLPFYVGDMLTITGQAVDAGACPEEGVAVKMSLTDPDGVESAGVFNTDSDGKFFDFFNANGVAGRYAINVESPVQAKAFFDLHPVVTSVSSTIGDVAGGQTITLTGAGFDAGKTSVLFRFAKTVAAATNVQVLDSQTIQFVTPPSPLPSQGPGYVELIVRVNAADSDPLSYEYIVPHQPVLRFTPNPCPLFVKLGLNTLETDAYNSDGSPASEQVTLEANNLAFFDANGNPASKIVVQTFTIVKMTGIATVTATPIAYPNLAITLNIKPPIPLSMDGCYPGLNISLGLVTYEPDPTLTTTVPALTSKDGQSFAWNGLSQGGQPNGYLLATPGSQAGSAPAATVVPRLPQVQVLGGADLRALTLDQPRAFTETLRDTKRLRLMGPNFRIASGRNPREKIWRAPAELSFPLPESDVSKYLILRLAPSAGVWVEVEPIVNNVNGRAYLRTKVSYGGVYALARAEPQ